MKRLLLLFALLTAVQFSFSQWTGTTDIYNTNSGNVGIGTTGPNAKLHVNGTAGSVQFLVQPGSAGHGIAKIASNGKGHAEALHKVLED